MALSAPWIPPQTPPQFTGTATSIVEDARRLIKSLSETQGYIIRNVSPDTATFSSVLLPLAQAENVMAAGANLLSFYKVVSPDSQLRKASYEAQKLFDAFAIESAMSEDLYRLVEAVLQKREDLDQESQRLLMKKHRDYIRNGLNLPDHQKRDRFKEIKRRLSQLTLKFKNNLVEEDGGLWFLPEDLEGVPSKVLSRLEKGEGASTCKLRLTFKYPDLYPALRYAKNGRTRERVYIGNENKCPLNVALFKEVVVLRDEAARLSGYPNHAAFRLEEKMAKTPETVNEFLDGLRMRLAIPGKRELENLKNLKKSDLDIRGQVSDGSFSLWDHGFYNRLMLETHHMVDHQSITEYFSLQSTVKSMLEIFEHLFSLHFVEVIDERDGLAVSGNGMDLIWHQDVQIFTVWDNEELGHAFIGYLYLDLYTRDGKYGHAANFNICPGFIQEDGTRKYPATALVCSFSNPTPTSPSLLNHGEIVTLFHELGHGIHDLVSKTTFSHFHGTNTVMDFAEAPSQMLENWCWIPSTLKSLSRHYSYLSPDYKIFWEEQARGRPQPPEKIPEEILESLIVAKHVNGALFNLRQLHLGIFDMTVHQPSNHEAIQELNISAKYNALRREILHMNGPRDIDGDEWGHGQANFGHLMGDYAVGYYGYLSSQVYSTDMFYTCFKEDPMNSKEGLRYRYIILERGGSRDEMEILTEFLGRRPNVEAFYKELGVS